MDPAPQSSFIPKQALAAQARGSLFSGLFFLLALVIFILSLVAAAGAFGYQYLLKGQLADKDVSLRTAEGAFDPGVIQDLVRIDSRMTQARALLQRHVAPSAVFDLLSTITLERVQFGTLDFQLQPDGSGLINLSGSADTFSAVALQSDNFGRSKPLRDVVFSGIAVAESGRVTFGVSAGIDAGLLLYNRLPAAAPAAAPAPTQ